MVDISSWRTLRNTGATCVIAGLFVVPKQWVPVAEGPCHLRARRSGATCLRTRRRTRDGSGTPRRFLWRGLPAGHFAGTHKERQHLSSSTAAPLFWTENGVHLSGIPDELPAVLRQRNRWLVEGVPSQHMAKVRRGTEELGLASPGAFVTALSEAGEAQGAASLAGLWAGV